MQPFEHVTRQLFPGHKPHTNVDSKASTRASPSSVAIATPSAVSSCVATSTPGASASAWDPAGAPLSALALALPSVRTFACGHVIPPSQVRARSDRAPEHKELGCPEPTNDPDCSARMLLSPHLSQILPLSVGRGPTDVTFDFTFRSRATPQQLNELGRLLVNVCNVTPEVRADRAPTTVHAVQLTPRAEARSLSPHPSPQRRVCPF